MSAAPPPPPYTPPPPSVDPRWARQNARSQRHAAKIALRQQRNLYRAQRRALRRRSLLGPLLLVCVGLVLLLLQIGKLQAGSVFAWLGHWWPLVLLGAGVVLLSEWAWDTGFGNRSASVVLSRRRFGPGAAFLIALLVGAGIVGHSIENGSGWALRDGSNFLSDSFGLDRIFAHHIDQELILSTPLPRNSLLTIQNYAGNITVTGSSQDGQVHVTAQQHLSAWQNSELQDHQRRNRPTLQVDGSGLLLHVAGEDKDRTDLVVEMPHDAALTIQGDRGELAVKELHGPLNITGHEGNINVTALTGPLTIENDDSDGDITGHSLSGDIQVSGRAGDLSFSDIAGSLQLHGDFFGTTHLERIQAPVHFESSYTTFSCAALEGDLEIEGRSELVANNVRGPVMLTTTDRDLTLDDIRGPVTVTNRNGPVHLTLAAPLAAVTVNSDNSNVELQVPTEASFQVSAETVDGQISNSFGLSSQERNGRSTLTGDVHHGGPQIKLSTSQGNINIHGDEPSSSREATKNKGEDENDD